MIETIYKFDHSILNAIIAHRAASMDFFWKTVTFFGDHALLWLLIIGFLLLVKKEWRSCLTIVVALGGTGVVGKYMIKHFIERPRPYMMYPEITNLIIPSDLFSFPSMHTATSFAAATVIFLYHKKAGTASYVAAAMIAFSRLYLGVHYPSDVLGGVVLGILGGFIASKLCNIVLTRCKQPES